MISGLLLRGCKPDFNLCRGPKTLTLASVDTKRNDVVPLASILPLVYCYCTVS
jgi:hypothetical protein